MKTKLLAAFAAMMAFGQTALADTATAITAIQAAVTADIGAVDTYVYAILVLSLSLWIGLKLIKRGANRAT